MAARTKRGTGRGAKAPAPTARELRPEELRWSCDAKEIRLTAGRKASQDVGTVGQDRALEALRMGVTMDSPGYNIYVCGNPGTGRTSAVRAILKDAIPSWSSLHDQVYVFNFRDPDRPRLLTLAPGQGRLFRKAQLGFVAGLRKGLQRAFEDSAYRKRRQEIVTKFRTREKELWTKFEEQVKKKSFVVVQIQDGPVTRQDVLPVVDGKPCTSSQLQQFVEQGRLKMADVERFTKIYVGFQPRLRSIVKKSRDLEREMVARAEQLEHEVALGVALELQEHIRERFTDKAVLKYLDEVAESAVENVEAFTGQQEEEKDGDDEERQSRRARSPMFQYDVNLVLDNSDTKGAPIVIETSPTFSNLFGTIERIERAGMWRSDFTGIRGGSMLRADGGFLVLNANDIIADPRLWITLKRMLKNRKLEIHEPEFMSPTAPTALKPEPIPLKLKVIMIGHASWYHILSALDEDFAKIFKVKSEFDAEMDTTRENLDHFVGVVEKISDEEDLRTFEKPAVARLVEYAVRMADRQGKLTTRFSDVANLMREANYWAARSKRSTISAETLERAVAERDRRHDLAEEKLAGYIKNGTLLIDTSGTRVGQLNGLAVYSLGNYEFGRPTRITAVASVGAGSIVNIERESNMSGATHDKGVLILEGFLRQRFGRDYPLSLHASLCFEQSYSGIDGDSASSTELYALLSALSGLPLRQDLAVTGSVNQMGDIQPIGGVNEKIEGFYKTCKARRLTGTQGVLIPHQNVQSLMLAQEVVHAVKQGRFHIWPVHTIDEGIGLLTGRPAPDVFALVDRVLRGFAERLRDFLAPRVTVEGAQRTKPER